MMLPSFVIPVSYLVVVSIDAFTDRRVKVNHKRGAIIYSIVCLTICGVDTLFKISGEGVLPHILFASLTRLAWFDPLRNVFAGKHPLYEGLNKRREERSWWDNLEYKTGIPIIVLRIAYICVYIIITAYYLIIH